MYGDAFVARAAERHGGHDMDLMATLTEFTARTIALGLQRLQPARAARRRGLSPPAEGSKTRP